MFMSIFLKHKNKKSVNLGDFIIYNVIDILDILSYIYIAFYEFYKKF